MTLPAATCRRAPVASAVIALTAALVAAALGYPPTSGWFSALLIAAAAVYLTDRRTRSRSGRSRSSATCSRRSPPRTPRASR